MGAFAFIFFPQTINQLKNFLLAMRIMPQFLLKSRLENLSAFKISHTQKIRSSQKKEIQGYFIACPLISEPDQELKEEVILEKITLATDMAKHLGANILGLDMNIPTIIEKRHPLYKKIKMPVTCGTAFTAWSIFEAVYRVTKTKNINLKSSVLTAIGTTSPIGSLCLRKLSEYAPKIILYDKNRDKLQLLKEAIIGADSEYGKSSEVVIEEDIYKAVKESNIVINVNGGADLLLRITEELKPDTILCDIGLSKNIIDKLRLNQDVTIIRGGLIKLPFPTNLGINLGLPKGIIFASIAETMLLTFENRLFSYNLDENINLDRLEELADVAIQHGFEIWVPEAPVL